MKHIKELLKEHSPKIDNQFVIDQFIKKVEEVVIGCIERGEFLTSIKLLPSERLIFKDLQKEIKQYGIYLEFNKDLQLFYLSWSI